MGISVSLYPAFTRGAKLLLPAKLQADFVYNGGSNKACLCLLDLSGEAKTLSRWRPL